jgi:hypothetical protein
MTSRLRLVGIGAVVGMVLSTALMALSFVTRSVWPILPGVYVVASVVGIHNSSMVSVALFNAVLIWIATVGLMALFRQRSGH